MKIFVEVSLSDTLFSMTKTESTSARRSPDKPHLAFGAQSAPATKLVDVARAAGVSLATASRALSSPDQVKVQTRDRVIEVANSLGYLAHGAARALASQRTRTIGAIFPPIDNPAFASGTHALSQTLAAAGYTLLLATHDYNRQDELIAARRLMERGVDGLVLVGMDHEPALMGLLEKAGVPFELTWLLDPAGEHFCVGIDHAEAASAMAGHLLDLGHRHFGVISGQTGVNDRAKSRLLGVRQRLSEAGIDLPDERIREASFSVTAGRAEAASLLDTVSPITALICANDTLAVGAVFECQSRGIRIPEQISVVGFDNIEVAGQMSPSMTTVHVPSLEIGREAGKRLLARLAGEAVPRCEKLPFTLIERDTSGPAVSI